MKSISITRIVNHINSVVDEVNCRKRNFKALPKAKDARLVPCTNTGKYTKDGNYTTKSWNIEVDCEVDGKIVTHDWNVWVVAAGMKCTTARFTDLAKAKAMKKEILAKWGKASEERETKQGEVLAAAIEKLAKSLGCSTDEVKALIAA